MALVRLWCLARWCQKQVLGGGGPGASSLAYSNDVTSSSFQAARQGGLLRLWTEHLSRRIFNRKTATSKRRRKRFMRGSANIRDVSNLQCSGGRLLIARPAATWALQ